jgi:hypothetical protein
LNPLDEQQNEVKTMHQGDKNWGSTVEANPQMFPKFNSVSKIALFSNQKCFFHFFKYLFTLNQINLLIEAVDTEMRI